MSIKASLLKHCEESSTGWRRRRKRWQNQCAHDVRFGPGMDSFVIPTKLNGIMSLWNDLIAANFNAAVFKLTQSRAHTTWWWTPINISISNEGRMKKFSFCFSVLIVCVCGGCGGPAVNDVLSQPFCWFSRLMSLCVCYMPKGRCDVLRERPVWVSVSAIRRPIWPSLIKLYKRVHHFECRLQWRSWEVLLPQQPQPQPQPQP